MNNISATAHLVTMYRPLETEHPDALFQDPFARRLAGGEGALIVELLGDKQQGTSAMAIRTCAIATMITSLLELGDVDIVFNLGAGLDTRPHRLNLPASLRWIEVDLPAIVTYKEQKLSGRS
ncbi:MAG: class I SAM-dependent methyltransferase [Phormidesmis sp. CAN_BIN44]|nr:class I SAM-dependent methyltransferase [Phormidesmis sp. CAN_BIN44]